jgi:hypothetical protein
MDLFNFTTGEQDLHIHFPIRLLGLVLNELRTGTILLFTTAEVNARTEIHAGRCCVTGPSPASPSAFIGPVTRDGSIELFESFKDS